MPCYVCGEYFRMLEEYRVWITYTQDKGSCEVKVHKGCVGLDPSRMHRVNNWTVKGQGMIDDGDIPVKEGIIKKDELSPEEEKLYDDLRELWSGR